MNQQCQYGPPPNSALQQEQPSQQCQYGPPPNSALQQGQLNPPWQGGQPPNSTLQQGQPIQQCQYGPPPNSALQQEQPSQQCQYGPPPNSALQQGQLNPPWQGGQPPNSTLQQGQPNQQCQYGPLPNSAFQQGQLNPPWQGGQPPNSTLQQGQPNQQCQYGPPPNSALQQGQPNPPWQGGQPPNSTLQQGQPNQQCQYGPLPNSALKQGQPNPPWEGCQSPNLTLQQGQPNQQCQYGPPPNSALQQGQPNPPWQGGQPPNSTLQQGQPNQQCQYGPPPYSTLQQGQPNPPWQGGQPPNSTLQQGQPNQQCQYGPLPNSALKQGQPNPPWEGCQSPNLTLQQGQPNQQCQYGPPPNSALQQGQPNPPWQGGQPPNSTLQQGQPNQQCQYGPPPYSTLQQGQPNPPWQGGQPPNSTLQQGQPNQQCQYGPPPYSTLQQGQPNPPWQGGQPPNSTLQQGQPNQQCQYGPPPNSALQQGQPNPPWQGGQPPNSTLQQGQPNQQCQYGPPPNSALQQGQPNPPWQGGQPPNSTLQQGQPNQQCQYGPPPNSALQQGQPNPPWQGGQPPNSTWQQGQVNPQLHDEQPPSSVRQQGQPSGTPLNSEGQQSQLSQQLYGKTPPQLAWQQDPINPQQQVECPPNPQLQAVQPNEQCKPEQLNQPLQIEQQPDQSWQTEQLAAVQGPKNSQPNHPRLRGQENQTNEEHNICQTGQSQKDSNKTISVGVEPDVMEYIEGSSHKDELQKIMKKKQVQLQWSQGSNYANLEHTGQTNETWQTECIPLLYSFLKKIGIRDLSVKEDICDDIQIQIPSICASLGDNPPLVKIFKDQLTLRIVSLCSNIEHFRSHFEAKLTEMYKEIETIPKVSKEHIKLLTAVNAKEKCLRGKCREVQIELDEEKQEIRLAGPRDQVKIAKMEFENQVRAATEKPLRLDPDFVQVLSTEQGQKAVKEALEDGNVEAIMVSSSKHQSLKVLASSEKHAEESASLISGLLTKDKLTVTAKHALLMKAEPWSAYCKKTKEKNGVLIRKNTSGETWVVGLKSSVHKEVRKLQYYLDHNAEREEEFRFPSSDVREYILRRIKPEIESYGVKVQEGKDTLSFYISGKQERLQKAEDLVKKLRKDVATSNVEFKQPGLMKFSESGELDARVKEVEEKEKCCIRVEKNLSSMSPAGRDSNGSVAPALQSRVGSSGAPGGNSPSHHVSSSGSDVLASTIDILVTPQGQKVSWRSGDITNEKVHALVIPQGACFNKIRSAFSPVICQAVDDLKVGEIATSSGTSLPCTHVIHSCCSFWDGPGNKGEGTLRSIVQKSLHEVGQLGGNSIAFPVIGTGNLNFPPNEACRIMLDETVKFCQRNPQSIVKDIRFVVFTGDKNLIDAFQKEASKIQNQGTNTAQSTVGADWTDIIELVNGDLTKERTDAIVNINSTSMDMNLAGELSKAVAKASGPQVQQECNQLGAQPAGSAAMTSGGNLSVRHIIHIIPGSSDNNHLQQCLEEGLRLADKRNLKTISIPAIGTGGYGLSASDSAQVSFQAVSNVCGNFSSVSKVRIVIYKAAMVQAFQQEQQKHSVAHSKGVPSLATPGSPISIDVINGDLTKEKTDAIVNINGTSMDMNLAGELSKAVAKASGPQVQQECNQLGAQPAGSAAMTSGGNLSVRHIIHIIPGSSDNNHLQQCLEEGLRLADKRNLKTISIPAIGTGGYGLSASDSAQVTFQAVRNVCGNFSSVDKVRIVVYQAAMMQAFHQEQQKHSVAHNSVVPSLATSGNPISIDVINGDLTKERTEAIVNINSTSMDMNSAGELGKAVAKASGPQVQQECSQLGSQRVGSAVITSGGSLMVPHIIHIIPGSSDKQHLRQCLEEGLRLADKRNLKSISIPAIGTGGYGLSAVDSANVVFEALSSFSGSCVNISEVRIVVFQSCMMPAFLQEKTRMDTQYPSHGSSRLASATCQSWNPTVRVWVTGKDKASVDKAVNELKKIFVNACVTKTVSTEDIGSLSQKQINNLHQEAYRWDTEIKFDHTAKCVTVRGYHGNVHDMASKIRDEISKGIKEKSQKQEDDYARVIFTKVEWSYESGGRKTAFDLKANAKLEMAHSKKDSTVQVTLRGKEFVVDLRNLTGRCRSDGEQVKICRNPKEGTKYC
ncbi:uncharacterized protein LOC144665081 [Oculina patagonica]